MKVLLLGVKNKLDYNSKFSNNQVPMVKVLGQVPLAPGDKMWKNLICQSQIKKKLIL